MITQDRAGVIAQMRKVIDAATEAQPDGYLPSAVAEQVVAELRASNPGLLQTWLEVQAVYFVHRMINDRDRAIRASTLAQRKTLHIRDALDEHNKGDETALTRFLEMPITNGEGHHRPLGSFRKAGLLTAAAGYRDRAARNAMTALKLEKLAERVGDKQVRDVFTEEQLAVFFDGLSKGDF